MHQERGFRRLHDLFRPSSVNNDLILRDFDPPPMAREAWPSAETSFRGSRSPSLRGSSSSLSSSHSESAPLFKRTWRGPTSRRTDPSKLRPSTASGIAPNSGSMNLRRPFTSINGRDATQALRSKFTTFRNKISDNLPSHIFTDGYRPGGIFRPTPDYTRVPPPPVDKPSFQVPSGPSSNPSPMPKSVRSFADFKGMSFGSNLADSITSVRRRFPLKPLSNYSTKPVSFVPSSTSNMGKMLSPPSTTGLPEPVQAPVGTSAPEGPSTSTGVGGNRPWWARPARPASAESDISVGSLRRPTSSNTGSLAPIEPTGSFLNNNVDSGGPLNSLKRSRPNRTISASAASKVDIPRSALTGSFNTMGMRQPMSQNYLSYGSNNMSLRTPKFSFKGVGGSGPFIAMELWNHLTNAAAHGIQHHSLSRNAADALSDRRKPYGNSVADYAQSKMGHNINALADANPLFWGLLPSLLSYGLVKTSYKSFRESNPTAGSIISSPSGYVDPARSNWSVL